MYGLSINQTVFSDVKFMFSHTLNQNNFTKYKGALGAAFVNVDTSDIFESQVGREGDVKVFFRKKSPFLRKANSFYLGIDQGFSGVRGADFISSEIRNGFIYIICKNPNDWEFKVYKSCHSMNNQLNNTYGIKVLNQDGVVTYSSGNEPCILKNLINVGDIVNNGTVSINRMNKHNYRPQRGGLCDELFEINNQKNLIYKGAYIELGIIGYFKAEWIEKYPPKFKYACLYHLAIDSNGLIRFIPTIGYAWGLYWSRNTAAFNATLIYSSPKAGLI